MKSAIDYAKEALEIEGRALLDAKNYLDEEFNRAVDIILGLKGKLVVIGVGKSGLIGAKIAATLSSTGTSSFFLHPIEAMHGDLGMIGKDDGVLAISYSGASEELINLLPHLKNFNIPIIGMSKSKNTPLGKFCDAHIDIKIKKEACPLGVAPTTSTTLTLALGDALAVALMQLKEFKKEDFAKFHPAGSLGKKLYLKAKHFLIPKDKLPIVDKETPLKEALIKMTNGRLGHLIVQEDGKLAGVFSDGDLRRALMKDGFSFNKKIEEFMTKTPYKIDNLDILAVDALKIIEDKKIQLLVVVDKENNIIGAIHIHDLIEAGVEA
ncbi:MAG: KpsF/GutQ family sugar-phosphate isomerase [Epsilonproteobacteria bacterium]|nr:KpsF/GutQ family sugar-phosphate isomerase [Campylobacterota bacterium]